MYRVGENPIKRRHHRIELFAVVVIVLIIGTVLAKHWFKDDTVIGKPPKALHTTVGSGNAATKTFNESTFTLNLPDDWKMQSQPAGAGIYTFQSTNTKLAGRILAVYVDSIPSTLGINRALSIQSNVNKVVPSGDVSDNCSSFTSMSSGSSSIATPAKWGGMPFLCDLGNYERDVVGTVSPDGINKVVLTGDSGQHSLFFTYTDNNINPDFSIFINALESFRLK